MGQNISVIIPAYNEQGRIKKTLDSLKGIGAIDEIIVVDDGSTDMTYEELKDRRDITLIHTDRNKGKGNAVKNALMHVKSRYVALLDADLCESSAEVDKLIGYVKPDIQSIIIGRFSSPSQKGGFGIVKGISDLGFYMLTGKHVASLLSGQRVLPTDFLKSFRLPEGFGLEFKITLEAVRQGYELLEVPVKMIHRETGRDFQGFIHRGRQCMDIVGLIIIETFTKRLRS
ncbi:MAG: glycosyltransferase family 2 protein [Pseudomonadota bacterium]